VSAGAIILAAGCSKRRALVRVIAAEACASRCDEVAVVVGAYEAEVRAALAGLDVTVVPNPCWPEGGASSIRAGVAFAAKRGFDAVVLVACDDMCVSAGHVDRLVGLYRRSPGVVATVEGGKLGLPAIFGRGVFPRLLRLIADEGVSAILRTDRSALAVPWAEAPRRSERTRAIPSP
jgi:molybdenum cofactor cytidylyltransferase